MDSQVINGLRGAYFQPPRYGRGEDGNYTVFTWEGTRDECLANVGPIEAAGGFWEMQESFANAKCVLVARFPRIVGKTQSPDELYEFEWELFSLDVEKDLMASDNIVLDFISQEEKARIRKWIQSPDDTKMPALTTEVAQDLFLLMLDGERSIEVPRPVLRKTLSASKAVSIGLQTQNCFKVYKYETLLEVEGPTMREDFAENIPHLVRNADQGTQYGWLKKFPTIRAAANQRTQVVIEYYFGLWATLLYTFV